MNCRGLLDSRCLLFAAVALILTSLAFAKSADLPGPRDPLAFRDMGLYGGWNEHWFRDDCPFNYFIVQAWVNPESQVMAHGMSEENTWDKWLSRARTKGYRVVAVITPLGWQLATDKYAAFKAGIDSFMQSVDERNLYAITLSEEGIFWDGHHEVYKEVYKYVKQNYDVPVYQWYSPYAGAPGFGWPHLPADGWLIDEYARTGPSYETFIRSYVAHQVPLIEIVWAAPLMRDFDWDAAGAPAFDWQVEVNRKYNIPTAFFAWEGHGNVWGWSEEALPESKAVYNRAVMWAKQVRQTDPGSYEDTWDSLPCLRPQQIGPKTDETFAFEQDFGAGGGLVAQGAIIHGFRDVRWDGGPLELRPRKTGATVVEMLYPLQSEFPLKNLQVTVAGRTDKSLSGSIMASASLDGATWTEPQTLPASGTLIMDLSGYSRFAPARDIQIRVVMTGKAKRLGDVPANISLIKLEGRIVPPKANEVRVQSYPEVPVRWSTGFPGASALFTADVENATGLASGGNELCIQGIPGCVNTVNIRQKFVCDSGLDLNRILMTNTADGVNYAATNSLAVSLDGKDPLIAKSTSGKVNEDNLVIDTAGDERFRNLREFYVHMTMSCGAAAATPVSNRISGLAIEGVGSKVRE